MFLHNKQVLEKTRMRMRQRPNGISPLSSVSLGVKKQSSSVLCLEQPSAQQDCWMAPLDSALYACDPSLPLEQAAPEAPKRQNHQKRRRQKSGTQSQKRPREDAPVQKRPKKLRFQEQPDVNSGPSHERRTERKTRFAKLYHKGALLGTGGFGSVFAGIRKADGLQVAIKYVSKRRAEDQIEIPGLGEMPLEVGLMTLANAAPSPNILKLLEWFDQPSQYIMVLERPEPCQDVDSFCEDSGGRLNEDTARRVMKQLIKALHHCNSCGVLHRDVKPENLLIQTDTHEVKLFDFGCGDLLKSSYRKFAGTAEFAPPEWFQHRRYFPEEATVWSVGVTLYNLVCGFLPFRITKKTIEGNLSFPEGLSLECRDLICWCLSHDGADRPTLEDIEIHPWLQ